jgi:hypothetical protein
MTVVLTESPMNLPATGAYTTSAQRPNGEREPQREDDQAMCPGQWRHHGRLGRGTSQKQKLGRSRVPRCPPLDDHFGPVLPHEGQAGLSRDRGRRLRLACPGASASSTPDNSLKDPVRGRRAKRAIQVVGVGARMRGPLGVVEVFLVTLFSGGERHARRIWLLSGFEVAGDAPPICAG